MTVAELLEDENTVGKTRLEELHALFEELHEEGRHAVDPALAGHIRSTSD